MYIECTLLQKDALARKRLSSRLRRIYNILYKKYGPCHWWPADSPFEVAVGAILTQNTNWSNVEKAIINLKRKNALGAFALRRLDQRSLARLIRPSGYYNIKAKRLKSFISYLLRSHSGRIGNLKHYTVTRLRMELLNINGIGPETADSIILYAVKKPIFVIDAYTRRIMGCLGILSPDRSYDGIQSIFMQNLPKSTRLFNEYHALIVEHGKRVCKAKPLCQECILQNLKR